MTRFLLAYGYMETALSYSIGYGLWGIVLFFNVFYVLEFIVSFIYTS